MRISKFYVSTLKEAPAEADIASQKLMLRAGLIKKLGSGLYTWMPLGLITLRKVEAIVREESVENVEEALLSLEGMDTDIASKLAANGITTRDALADLAGDELVELTGMDAVKAQELIMKARAHWFEPAADAPQTGATL